MVCANRATAELGTSLRMSACVCFHWGEMGLVLCHVWIGKKGKECIIGIKCFAVSCWKAEWHWNLDWGGPTRGHLLQLLLKAGLHMHIGYISALWCQQPQPAGLNWSRRSICPWAFSQLKLTIFWKSLTDKAKPATAGNESEGSETPSHERNAARSESKETGAGVALWSPWWFPLATGWGNLLLEEARGGFIEGHCSLLHRANSQATLARRWFTWWQSEKHQSSQL